MFANMDTVIAHAANADVVNGVLSCDSENIEVLVSDKCTDLNNTTLEIYDTVDCFIFNGYGKTFNNLACGIVKDADGAAAIFCWIGFLLIVLFGHVLNIAMSCLSAYVHPLRLTFVEYFKNAGYDGKGAEYKPFKNK